jgi:hypothetical protein
VVCRDRNSNQNSLFEGSNAQIIYQNRARGKRAFALDELVSLAKTSLSPWNNRSKVAVIRLVPRERLNDVRSADFLGTVTRPVAAHDPAEAIVIRQERRARHSNRPKSRIASLQAHRC